MLKKITALFTMFAVVIGCSCSSMIDTAYAAEPQASIVAVEDTFIDNSSWSRNNNNRNELVAGKGTIKESWETEAHDVYYLSYIKFDTSDCESYGRVKFSVWCKNTDTKKLGIYGIPDTSWNETELNWKTAPGIVTSETKFDSTATEKLGEITTSGAGRYDLDISEYFAQNRANGAITIGIAEENNECAYLGSREDTDSRDRKPYLYLTPDVSALTGINIEGGSLSKDFVPGERYYQAVADEGRETVSITAEAPEGTVITIDGNVAESGKPVEIRLREDGYGYKSIVISTSTQNGYFFQDVTLAILKPAPSKEVLYTAKNRPQFHYTAPYGFINDPNGMLYNAHTGEYHFFYQAYPYEAQALAKHWGHATTTDLVHFEEKSTALYPDENGDMWSGSGIIDYTNTAGLYDESTPEAARMVLIYYAHSDFGVNAGLAYTEDGGETWVKERDNNGDIKLLTFVGMQPAHIDPKVFWLDDEQLWVMMTASGYLYTSNDLHTWTFNSSEEAWECPDIYEIKVEGTNETKWVRTYGGSFYYVGSFTRQEDGTLEYIKEYGPFLYNGDSHQFNNTVTFPEWIAGDKGVVYATQHFKDAPNDRIIAMSWLREQYVKRFDDSMTWAGAMTVATEQKLYKNDDSYLLYSYPVEEIKSLREDKIYAAKNITVTPESENILEGKTAVLADIEGKFKLDESVTEFGFKLRTGNNGDITVKYDVTNGLLVFDPAKSGDDVYQYRRTMKMEIPENRTVDMRILLDNIIIESFGNKGEAAISSMYSRPESCIGMEFYTLGGNVTIEFLDIYSMTPSWKNVSEPPVRVGDASFANGIVTLNIEETDKTFCDTAKVIVGAYNAIGKLLGATIVNLREIQNQIEISGLDEQPAKIKVFVWDVGENNDKILPINSVIERVPIAAE